MTMFSNVLNSLIKITWRQKTNNNTKKKKMKIIIIKEERIHTCIVMGFRHSHIKISFTPKMIYNSFKSYWNERYLINVFVFIPSKLELKKLRERERERENMVDSYKEFWYIYIYILSFINVEIIKLMEIYTVS